MAVSRRGPQAGYPTLAIPWEGGGMITLGIETATDQVGVALGDNRGIISSFQLARGRRHAETVAPAVEMLCQQSEIEVTDVGVVAVDIGPGLFTGLRVGVSTAKAMAQALRVGVVGMSSLDLLAFPLRHCERMIVPVVDARR